MEWNVPVCPICKDFRFVTTHVEARRYMGHGGPSQVFPCPVCGPFVMDGDGSKYKYPGKRYGNPNLTTDEEYYEWRSRNTGKAEGWHASELRGMEKNRFEALKREYPLAKPEWVKAWVLGERRVYHEAEP